MRPTGVIFILAIVALLLGARGPWSSWADVDPAAAVPGYASQDYRASQFAVQTGWMTFRELWFTAGR
jgi:hypothetical protein